MVQEELKDAARGSTVATGSMRLWARRVFGRPLMDVALVVLVGVLLSDLRQPREMFVDPDLWWHIANGRIVALQHAFIHLEPYSFTVAGQPWIDPEWLLGLLYWLGYAHFNLVGIVAVAAIGVLGNVLLLYARSSSRSGSPAVALWTTVLGILLMTVNNGARMILFGYLALAAEMLILERARRGSDKALWLLPPLFALWINLHGSWAIGIAVFVLYIGCGWESVEKGVFSQAAFTAVLRKRLLTVLGVSVAFLFVNPYGWRLIWNPFDMQFGQKLNLGHVQEWQPLNLNEFLGKMVVLALLLMLSANVIKPRKWTVFEMALFLFAWYEAFAHVRFTFLAVVLTMPMITADVARAFFPPAKEQKTIPVMNGLIAASVVAILALWFVPTNAKLHEGFAEEMPLKTIAMIQPEWRTLNQDNFGGWMDFNGKPTFLDSRFDTFEHHGVLQDFLDIFQVHDSLRLMEKYRVDHVLAKADSPLTYLLERTPGWVVVTREGKKSAECVLFARTAVAPSR
jgi:hypothetical protein